MELVKDVCLDVVLSSLIGALMGMLLSYQKNQLLVMDWQTMGLLNLFLLLAVHVSIKVLVRYRLLALVIIPAILLYLFPWVFGLLFQVAQLALYTWS